MMSLKLASAFGPTLLVLALAGCAGADSLQRQADSRLGLADRRAPRDNSYWFRRIGQEPANARLHLDNGIYLLGRGTVADLQVARVAFANASRLAPDAWRAEAGLAATEYLLGDYDAATMSLAEAVQRKSSCAGLCRGLAFTAFKAGHFGLAQAALEAARREGPMARGADADAEAFVSAALAEGAGGRDATEVRARLAARQPASAANVEGNVLIDAYIIRQRRSSGATRGIDLLDALKLQFGGTLIDGQYERERTDGGPWSSTRTERRALEVGLPTVNYALNVATEDRTRFHVEASPRIVATAGNASRFFEGANVLIVPAGEYTDNVERDIGTDFKVTPVAITAEHVELKATLELSNIASQQLVTGAVVLRTEKAVAEASARVPFGRAMLLGSGASAQTQQSEAGWPRLRKVPLLGDLFGGEGASTSRNDVVVLLSVRRASELAAQQVDEAALVKKLFARELPAVARIALLPHEAPQLDLRDWLRTD